ncbi:hypothetical protein GCM10029978_021310 [Actinoallomurus acanthiterrae]
MKPTAGTDGRTSTADRTPGSTVYLAIRLPPGVVPSDLAEIQCCLATSARHATASGRPVRYLHGMYVPSQARLLCAFAAESAEVVHAIAESARLPYDRIDDTRAGPERAGGPSALRIRLSPPSHRLNRFGCREMP